MLELDVEYVRRQSFAYDMWLLLRTPWAVLSAHTA
jgi:lipopolysaccharide/colanic/teichoic acid biosynthesis glycosyltransferase